MNKDRYLILIFAVLCYIGQPNLFAQTPQKLSYQAIIRNSDNSLVLNSKIGLQITLLKGSATGTPVYVETQQSTTNAFGMINIEFGGNQNFSSIFWTNSDFFIKTEVDPKGGTNYSISGVSQLLSLPYVFSSKTSDGVVCMTQYQIESLPHIAGLIVYNTTSNELVFYDGNVWKSILSQ